MRMAVLSHRDQRTILTLNRAIVGQFSRGKSLVNLRLQGKSLIDRWLNERLRAS
jgi:hypothetical protein